MSDETTITSHRFSGGELPRKLHADLLQSELDASLGMHVPLVIRYIADWVPDAIEVSYPGPSREADIRAVLKAHAPQETHREECERVNREAAGETSSLRDLVTTLRSRLDAVENK